MGLTAKAIMVTEVRRTTTATATVTTTCLLKNEKGTDRLIPAECQTLQLHF